MDGATEPVILVIGHPIAGNPTQFAIERALKSMQLEWRVLSSDVTPSRVGAALEGAEALGFVGVFVDPTLSSAAKKWVAANRSDKSDASEIDCLARSEDRATLVHHGFQAQWLVDKIAQHEDGLGRPIEKRIWLGEFDQALSLKLDGFAVDQPTPLPPDPDAITESDLVVIANSVEGGDDAECPVSPEPVPLEVEEWQENDGSIMVIDLTDGHPDLPQIRRSGYTVVATEDRRIATLQCCLRQWTQLDPSIEVIHDAIEEYLAV